ncbi:hypothetical protein NVV78_08155 [Pediococcus ethanolidurans]|uniref:hypothetical protein n=1 Tax=Pediococcus ethanolidurans TaxID=319653 RepID=UPI0021E7C2AC|nr:hypothetical protein [Pediococcus ethanolidurans]MCV3315912.1 hypothetical protein [Pediococcus ethanolidurans]
MKNIDTDKPEKLKIIGFLDKRAALSSIYELDSKEYLNDTIIRPLRVSDQRFVKYDDIDQGVQDLLIFGKDANRYKKIEKYANNLNVSNVKFYSINSNIKEYMNTYSESLIGIIIFIIIISIIVIGLSIWNLSKSLLTIKKDLFVRKIIGQSEKSMYQEIATSQIMLTLICWTSTVGIVFLLNAINLHINYLNFWEIGFLGFQWSDFVGIIIDLIALLVISEVAIIVVLYFSKKRGGSNG